MAFQHYMLVNDSCLYEGKGIAKPLLARIAHLIIAEPEENEQGKPKGDRNPDAGWCIATQDYLAANLGCSESQVQKWIDKFGEDGWLEKETVSTKFGRRNRYRLSRVPEIEHLKMQKDEQSRFVRQSNPKKKRLTRREKGRYITAPSGVASRPPEGSPKVASSHTSPLGAATHHGSEPSPITALCGDPHRSERQELVVAGAGAGELSRRQARHSAQTDTDKNKIQDKTRKPQGFAPNPTGDLLGPETQRQIHSANAETLPPAAPVGKPAYPYERTMRGHKFLFVSKGTGDCQTCGFEYRANGVLPTLTDCPKAEVEFDDYAEEATA